MATADATRIATRQARTEGPERRPPWRAPMIRRTVPLTHERGRGSGSEGHASVVESASAGRAYAPAHGSAGVAAPRRLRGSGGVRGRAASRAARLVAADRAHRPGAAA